MESLETNVVNLVRTVKQQGLVAVKVLQPMVVGENSGELQRCWREGIEKERGEGFVKVSRWMFAQCSSGATVCASSGRSGVGEGCWMKKMRRQSQGSSKIMEAGLSGVKLIRLVMKKRGEGAVVVAVRENRR
ncbi:hypothetical protein HAX54_049621 [Datura stramonium]|uniref:Uncharacterized protein n=1 Tax=Datura stramonium TaxID=4076 RepID=A0ABS8SVQ1_DATST|nr:hypothetical protein [Datura stramonium]